MKILVVEDHPTLVEEIRKQMEKHFEVQATQDGLEAVYYIEQKIFDLIILDIMLPGMDGMEVLRTIREKNIMTPVIMLTAKEALDDKVGAFMVGANDYLTKPFYMEELLARVYAILRTNGRITTKNRITFQQLEMDLESNRVYINGEEMQLQNKQFQLLQYFLVNQGRILLKEQIFDRIWGIESDSNIEIVEVYVSQLRKKLSSYGYDQYLKTKRGVGYIFDGEF